MQNATSTTMTSYSLKPEPVIDFVSKLPEHISVEALSWQAYHKLGRKQMVISQRMQRNSVQSCRMISGDTELKGRFNAFSKENIIRAVKDIASDYAVPIEKFKIEYINLSSPDATVAFIKMRKQLKGQKIQIPVLQKKGGTGDIDAQQRLISELNGKKHRCTINTEERRSVLCEEVTI